MVEVLAIGCAVVGVGQRRLGGGIGQGQGILEAHEIARAVVAVGLAAQNRAGDVLEVELADATAGVAEGELAAQAVAHVLERAVGVVGECEDVVVAVADGQQLSLLIGVGAGAVDRFEAVLEAVLLGEGVGAVGFALDDNEDAAGVVERGIQIDVAGGMRGGGEESLAAGAVGPADPGLRAIHAIEADEMVEAVGPTIAQRAVGWLARVVAALEHQR